MKFNQFSHIRAGKHAPPTKLPLLPLKLNRPRCQLQEKVPTVTTSPVPSLIYDYHGFPPESYLLTYPAPGNPALAHRVATLLRGAGLQCHEDATRGLDHGAFIPLLLSHPKADIPVVQLSLMSSLDAEAHVRMGEALAPLREEGVLIYGSGLSFHNMGAFRFSRSNGGGVDAKSGAFDAFLHSAVVGDWSKGGWEERKEKLVHWEQAPEARYAHPREEHLLPLMVAFGAAKGGCGEAIFKGELMGAQVSSFKFD